MTFQELMGCWDKGTYNSNQFVYAQILDQAKKKNLVPVIGAGLSAWVGYPMWDELLRRHGAEFDAEEAVEAHLAAWRYEEAAEVMAKASGDTWFDILRDSFDPRQIAERRGNRPAYQNWLPQLFRGLVLTTNFDRCLEDLYSDPDSVNPGDDFQKKRAERAGLENRHLLIKLHGDIHDPWNMVLIRTAYDDCYGADPTSPDLTKPMPAFLAEHEILADRPLFPGIAYQYAGDLQRRLGQVDEALEAYAQAEALYRKERDDLGLANTLRSRGDLQSRLGESDKALEQYRSACSLYRKEQEPVGLCCTLAELYRIYVQAGQRTEAEPIRRELEKLLPGVPADVQEYVNGIFDTAQPGMGC